MDRTRPQAEVDSKAEPDSRFQLARKRRRKVPQPIRHILVFDTETSVDVAQGLLFGVPLRESRRPHGDDGR